MQFSIAVPNNAGTNIQRPLKQLHQNNTATPTRITNVCEPQQHPFNTNLFKTNFFNNDNQCCSNSSLNLHNFSVPQVSSFSAYPSHELVRYYPLQDPDTRRLINNHENDSSIFESVEPFDSTQAYNKTFYCDNNFQQPYLTYHSNNVLRNYDYNQPNHPIAMFDSENIDCTLQEMSNYTHDQPSYRGYLQSYNQINIYTNNFNNNCFNDNVVNHHNNHKNAEAVASLPDSTSSIAISTNTHDIAPSTTDPSFVSSTRQSSPNKKATKRRYILKKEFQNLLEAAYQRHKNFPYFSRELRENLAKECRMSSLQVRKWLSNRRNKDHNTRPLCEVAAGREAFKNLRT